jgi:sporulation protein YlmC with PRC-barrel domain
MGQWHGRKWIDLGTGLLDYQIVDTQPLPVGKVDDLELRRRDDGRLEVSALVVGTSALLPRLGKWAARPLSWVMRLFGGPDEPRLIPIEQVRGIDVVIEVTEEASRSAVSPSEQRLRRKVIQRIPGAGDASR